MPGSTAIFTTHTDTLSQAVTIPAACTGTTFSFWLHIDTAETTTTTAFDKLTITANGTTIATFSNLNHASGYRQRQLLAGASLARPDRDHQVHRHRGLPSHCRPRSSLTTRRSTPADPVYRPCNRRARAGAPHAAKVTGPWGCPGPHTPGIAVSKVLLTASRKARVSGRRKSCAVTGCATRGGLIRGAFCTKCGTAIERDGKFCTKCGSPLRTEPGGPPEPPTVFTPPAPPSDARRRHGDRVQPRLHCRASPASRTHPPPPCHRASQASRTHPPPPCRQCRPRHCLLEGSWRHRRLSPRRGHGRPTQPSAGSARPPRPGQGSAYERRNWASPVPPGPAVEWPPSAPPGQNGPGPPWPPGRPRPGRFAAWIGFVALVLVLGGGFAAWKFLGHHTTNHPSAAGSPTGPANGTGPGSSKSTAPSSPTPPATSPTPAGLPRGGERRGRPGTRRAARPSVPAALLHRDQQPRLWKCTRRCSYPRSG